LLQGRCPAPFSGHSQRRRTMPPTPPLPFPHRCGARRRPYSLARETLAPPWAWSRAAPTTALLRLLLLVTHAARLHACASEGSAWPVVGSHSHGQIHHEALPGGAVPGAGGAHVAGSRSSLCGPVGGVGVARSSGVADGHRVPRPSSHLHRSSARRRLRLKWQEAGYRQKRANAPS
jgi:hypothetical protein